MPPGAPTAAQPAPPAVAYCSAARRLRARHGGHPARLHRELRDLADRSDGPGKNSRVAAVVTAPSSQCESFAREVAGRLDGPVLRHTDRRALLAAAGRRGIGRFEASLVIAAVQHRHAAPAGRQVVAAKPTGAWSVITLAACVQALIVWGAWHVFAG